MQTIATDDAKTPTEKRAVWFKLIEDYKASSQTQINFCKLQNINKDLFVYYLAKWRKINTKGSPSMPFQRVEVIKRETNGKCLLNFAPGLSLEFPDGISIQNLSELILNLRQSIC
jgi:hypothetical protein